MSSSSLSKGKAKQLTSPAPLPNPSAGSANPSASLSSLWGYIQPALDHLIRSPTNDTTRAPAIDVSFHMGIHTAAYNYFASQSESGSSDLLYAQLDQYMRDTARELLLGAPQDDSTLIHYIIPCFNRYSAGAHSVNRLLNYVNRHYVKRAVDEDKGWLRLNDILESVAKVFTPGDARQSVSKKLRERRTDELKKWGYEEGSSAELLAQAEACAEAASLPDRVVPISSLAMRRFRIEFIEPLLAVPKLKLKGRPKVKKKIPQPSTGSTLPGPKSRLARALRELLESKGRDEEEIRRLATELAKTLRIVGVRGDHALRKKLDKFLAPSA